MQFWLHAMNPFLAYMLTKVKEQLEVFGDYMSLGNTASVLKNDNFSNIRLLSTEQFETTVFGQNDGKQKQCPGWNRLKNRPHFLTKNDLRPPYLVIMTWRIHKNTPFRVQLCWIMEYFPSCLSPKNIEIKVILAVVAFWRRGNITVLVRNSNIPRSKIHMKLVILVTVWVAITEKTCFETKKTLNSNMSHLSKTLLK